MVYLSCCLYSRLLWQSSRRRCRGSPGEQGELGGEAAIVQYCALTVKARLVLIGLLPNSLPSSIIIEQF